MKIRKRLLLKDPKVDVNKATHTYSMTPLYIASLKNYADIVQELLEQPEIDVMLPTKPNGEWSFSVAINKNHKEVADLIKKRIENEYIIFH